MLYSTQRPFDTKLWGDSGGLCGITLWQGLHERSSSNGVNQGALFVGKPPTD